MRGCPFQRLIINKQLIYKKKKPIFYYLSLLFLMALTTKRRYKINLIESNDSLVNPL